MFGGMSQSDIVFLLVRDFMELLWAGMDGVSCSVSLNIAIAIVADIV